MSVSQHFRLTLCGHLSFFAPTFQDQLATFSMATLVPYHRLWLSLSNASLLHSAAGFSFSKRAPEAVTPPLRTDLGLSLVFS